ncbi:MAG: PorT family protein [Bacteroidales bacterium]|nr:PorT family protein [Bacteroidales bacterium]
MKKLLIALTAIFFAVNANAQFGIIAGVTSTQTDYESAWANAKDINQFHVGATVKVPLPLGFAVQPGIIYNMKGSSIGSITAEGSESTFSIDSKTGFLEVPVQIQWGIDLAGVVRPYVFAEPFVGYAITNETSTDFNVSTVNIENTDESWDNVKNRLEYGFGLGAGVELIKHLQVSVRYFWNMGELYDENESSVVKSVKDAINTASTTAKEQKCSGVMASVAILF